MNGALRGRIRRALSRQLGHPTGALGTVVMRRLNRVNRVAIEAAVDALELEGGETVADIGFGGGVGLDLLLDRVGPTGHVHGVDPSASAVATARKRRAVAVQRGRLSLTEAGMADLPFADGALDAWISLNTIYFVDDLVRPFAELRRVLATAHRGVLGLMDPAWMAEQAFTEQGFIVRPVTQVVEYLQAAGLAVEERTVAGDDRGVRLLICRPYA